MRLLIAEGLFWAGSIAMLCNSDNIVASAGAIVAACLCCTNIICDKIERQPNDLNSATD